MNKAVGMTWTVTSTWTWVTRTFTATEAWTFVAWDADASILNATLIQTPTETFWIDTYISGTVVTATSDNAWYTNETWVDFSNFYKLFEGTTWEISWTDHINYPSTSVQTEFSINETDRLLVAYFAVATTAWDKVISFYKNGQDHYSNIVSPLVYRHNDLDWLNEWEYKHLTIAQLAVVNATSNSNTWDQTDMDWISDTVANFNSSVSDWNFATLSWAETLTNKTVNWVILTTWWAATNFLNEEWNYVASWGWGWWAFTTTTNVTSNSEWSYATDDFVFGSPQLDDDWDTAHDKRMFFDKSSWAFRAWWVNSTQWDSASLWANSVAFWTNTKAAILDSMAIWSTCEVTWNWYRAFVWWSGSKCNTKYSIFFILFLKKYE